MLTSIELRELAKDRSPRLKAMIGDVYKSGAEVNTDDLDQMITALRYSGDEQDMRWMQSLKMLIKDGSIDSLRNGDETWDQHRVYVKSLVAQKKIPFDINDTVISNDSAGRRGIVVDYVPDSDMYVVIFDPFQIDQFKPGELIKVAAK